MHRSRTHRSTLALLLGAGGFSLAACDAGLEPSRFELSQATLGELAEEPEVAEQIRSSLEMLFGTPQKPRYMLVADWADEGYDPNWPKYERGDQGSGEFDEERLARIQADNERRFARELALIDAGNLAALGPIPNAPGLSEALRYVVEHPEEFEDHKAELRRTLVEYYPSLRDSAELYRVQCVHCHGESGGGDGPTAPFLNPRPRDYRPGIFKFTAVKDKSVPRRDDLYRILVDGVTGTAMPSFRRFSDAELEGLVDYVRLLSKRGMTERLLVAEYGSKEVLTPEVVTETYLDVFERWEKAPEKFVAFDGAVPAPTPAMLERGKKIFNDEKTGNCASCHGVSGLGDGASAWKEAEDGSKKRVPAYLDDWGHPIVPRNLKLGLFRGGKRPIDIYRRIYSGINGTPMPAIGESKDAAGELLLGAEDMWSLVHYVRSLSESPGGIGIDPHPLVGRHGDSAPTGESTH